ncbi:MAG: efflux RND transporter periplasmic adaptor subunit [Thermoanaerobaculaceae bacterium]|jgi:RND family efflux transporter MFP subunit
MKDESRLVPLAALAVAASILVLFVSACSRSREAKAHQAPTVAVARVAVEDLTRDLSLTAELRPFQEIEVMAKVAGFVKAIYVDIGDRVKKGQLLALLEVPEMVDDLASGRAALKRSEAEAERARDELRRAQAAHDIADLSFTRLSQVAAQRPGLVAQQEIDDVKSRDLVTDAQVAAARSGLDAANEQIGVSQAALERIKTMLDYARVTAPFNGVVTKRYADTGSMIQAGTASQTQAMPLVRLSQNSVLRLIVPVPESAVPTVHVGQQVEVLVPTLNRAFSGKVDRFASRLSASTRTMDTEIDVPNPGLVLFPGMYAEVRLNLDRREKVLAIPVTAVDLAGGEASQQPKGGASGRSGQVMVVAADNRVEVRIVSLGLETADKVEVLSGLKEGDLVVISGRSSLQADQEVQPKVTVVGGAPSSIGR